MHLEVYNPQPIMLWFAIKEIGYVLMTKYPMNQNMAKSVNKQTCRFGSVFYAPASVGCEGVSFAIGMEICSRMGEGAFEEWKYRYSLCKSFYEKMTSLYTIKNKTCTLPLL